MNRQPAAPAHSGMQDLTSRQLLDRMRLMTFAIRQIERHPGIGLLNALNRASVDIGFEDIGPYLRMVSDAMGRVSYRTYFLYNTSHDTFLELAADPVALEAAAHAGMIRFLRTMHDTYFKQRPAAAQFATLIRKSHGTN